MKSLCAPALLLAALPLCLTSPLSSAQATPPATRRPNKPPHPPRITLQARLFFRGPRMRTARPRPRPAKAALPRSSRTPIANDSERQAVTFTAFDMDVHFRPEVHQIAVRAHLVTRNDGKTPLAHIPLQLSSQLNWERIRVDGRDIAFQVATLNADSDHTGQLHEAAVPLALPLRPAPASTSMSRTQGPSRPPRSASSPSARRKTSPFTTIGTPSIRNSQACAVSGMLSGIRFPCGSSAHPRRWSACF